MTVDTTVSHLDLIQHQLSTRHLLEFARRRGLPLRDLDLGYAVHCWLRECWGSNWPKPFAIEEHGAHLLMLAYHRETGEATRQDIWATIEDDLRMVATDKFPKSQSRSPDCWSSQSLIGFRCRACPTRRIARGSEPLPAAPNAPPDRQRRPGPGDELDAWQHYLARHPDTPAHPALRDQVYCDWFRDRLNKAGGAELEAVRITGMQRLKLLRRTQAAQRDRRQHRRVELPAITFDGLVRITDPTAFTQLLAHGIGRHRAFGFGMVLLKPA